MFPPCPFPQPRRQPMSRQAMTALLMIITAACQNQPPRPAPPSTPAASTPAKDESEIAFRKALLAQRRAAEKRWIDAAKMVAEKTADPVAIGIADFIAKNALLGQPAPNGMISLLESRTTQPKPVMLIVILPADVLRYSELGVRISSTAAATFNPEPPHISLYPQPVSELWQGLLLLHEGAHASMFLSEPYDMGDPEISAMREVEVNEFCNRLLSDLGGSAYQALLETEIARLKADRATTKPAGPGQQYIGKVSLDNDQRLEQVFGPSKTDFEKDTRRATFFTHASFELINRDLGKDSQAAIAEKTSWYMNVEAILKSIDSRR